MVPQVYLGLIKQMYQQYIHMDIFPDEFRLSLPLDPLHKIHQNPASDVSPTGQNHSHLRPPRLPSSLCWWPCWSIKIHRSTNYPPMMWPCWSTKIHQIHFQKSDRPPLPIEPGRQIWVSWRENVNKCFIYCNSRVIKWEHQLWTYMQSFRMDKNGHAIGDHIGNASFPLCHLCPVVLGIPVPASSQPSLTEIFFTGLQKFSSPGLLEVSCFKICCQPGLSKMWGQMLKIGRMLVCRSPKLANILYGYWTHYVNIQGVSKKCNIAIFSLNLHFQNI